MKKGFTLVELLAVIAILAIILVISVPKILNVIDSSKSNVYISDCKLLLKAAELYMASNDNLYPQNIGETSEISLSELINNNYIDEIKRPNDKENDCSGYVSITKTKEKEYKYIPHLNCEKEINSSTEDGLILHYTFDDFQEPTQNLFQNLNLGLHLQGGISYQYVGKEDGWYKYSISGTGTSDTYPYTFNINPGNINSDYYTSFSFLYKTNVPNKYLTFGVSGMVNIIYKPGYKTTDVNMGEYRSAKIEKVSPLSTTSGVPIVGSTSQSIYFLSRPIANMQFNPNTDFLYFKDIQVESKEYATPYTEGTREGIVKDYSANENTATLSLNITPKYVTTSKVGEGAYKFNGIDQVISVPLNKINYPYTLILWANRSGDFLANPDFVGIAGFRFATESLNGIHYYPDYQIRYKDFGGNPGSISSGVTMQKNTWYNIAITHDATTVKTYINGSLINSTAQTLSTYNSSEFQIGATKWTDGQNRAFDGLIDDVRIYNRVLDDNEIKSMYDITK